MTIGLRVEFFEERMLMLRGEGMCILYEEALVCFVKHAQLTERSLTKLPKAEMPRLHSL